MASFTEPHFDGEPNEDDNSDTAVAADSPEAVLAFLAASLTLDNTFSPSTLEQVKFFHSLDRSSSPTSSARNAANNESGAPHERFSRKVAWLCFLRANGAAKLNANAHSTSQGATKVRGAKSTSYAYANPEGGGTTYAHEFRRVVVWCLTNGFSVDKVPGVDPGPV